MAVEAKATAGGFGSKVAKSSQFENLVFWGKQSKSTRRIEVRMATSDRFELILKDDAWTRMTDLFKLNPDLAKKKIFFFGDEALSFEDLKPFRSAFETAQAIPNNDKAVRRAFRTLETARNFVGAP